MGMAIVRGASFRIKFKPTSNVNVGELGDPFITIAQELVALNPEAHVDTENNLVYADVDEADSILLVDDVETWAQLMFSNENGKSYRFQIHDLTILPSLFGSRQDEIDERQQEEETPVEPEPEEQGA